MRGSEKKIIHVRDTGSRIFEEAYFVLRRGAAADGDAYGEGDMVSEAMRIVTQNGDAYPATLRRRRRRAHLGAFVLGACCATLAIVLGAVLLTVL